MKQATARKKERKKTDYVDRRLREGAFILFCSLSIYFFIALITYSEGDSAWSHSGVSNQIQNAAGKAGAWIADILFFIFGFLAYFSPLLMLGGGLWIYRGTFSPGSIRLAGSVLFLLSACSLASLLRIGSKGGGWLGSVIHTLMVNYVNTLGAVILLVSLWLISITLLTGFSWLKSVMQVKEKTIDKVKKIIAIKKKIENKLPMLYLSFEEEKDSLPAFLEEKVEKKVEKKPGKKHEEKSVQKTHFTNMVSASIPSLGLLETVQENYQGYTPLQLQELSRLVESRLKEFGIEAKVVGIQPGPVITRFELDLAAGIKVNKITTLVKDLARSLSVVSVRVVEVIPGKSVVGLEIPNTHRERVRLREILQHPAYQEADSPLSLALGKDISGLAYVVDLAKMPHLLVAGTTGSGKSVGLNAMLLSILYKATPLEVRLILIDPKQLELAVYDHIPHLLTPVVTDMKEAANALRWCVAEMERRYQLMAALGVRNLLGYNQKIEEAIKKGAPILDPFWHAKKSEKPDPLEKLPFIVVVVDEFADMMMVVGKKVEDLITRIAQKARAAGIHLILATQRPSVDVITGLIKANIPTRIAFQVSSRIDSRTILDQSGAEQLLGYGDMLYLPPGAGIPHRIHGAFVGDDEVHKVAEGLRKLGKPTYIEHVVQLTESALFMDQEEDELYDQAVMMVTASRKASASLVQRRLKIGYNRAARLIEQMETQGIISVVQSNGMREVLAPPPVEE